MEPQPQLTTQQARRGLIIYFLILLPLSLIGYWFYIAQGNVLPIASAPAVASIFTRLIRREGLRDVSFKFGGWQTAKAILLVVVFPLVICLIVYGAAWLLGLSQFEPAQLPSPFPNPAEPLARFALTIPLAMTLATAWFLPFAAGEEIGWRGYMLTRLIDAKIPQPILLSGVIWAVWHVPLIISGEYTAANQSNYVITILFFLIVVTAFSFLLAKIRFSTGSIWAVIIAHAAWNAITQAAFNAATRGDSAYLWIGESGILTAIVIVVAVGLVWKYNILVERAKLKLSNKSLDARRISCFHHARLAF